MRQFGYLDKTYTRFGDSEASAESIYDPNTLSAAIKSVQKFGGLNETGQLDEQTTKVSEPHYHYMLTPFSVK